MHCQPRATAGQSLLHLQSYTLYRITQTRDKLSVLFDCPFFHQWILCFIYFRPMCHFLLLINKLCHISTLVFSVNPALLCFLQEHASLLWIISYRVDSNLSQSSWPSICSVHLPVHDLLSSLLSYVHKIGDITMQIYNNVIIGHSCNSCRNLPRMHAEVFTVTSYACKVNTTVFIVILQVKCIKLTF